MAESIFIRVQRVLSGQVEMSVDALERVSSGSLMRQSIREIDQAIDEAREQHRSARARISHAERQQQLARERLATLEEQARFALSKGRDDLAQAAIACQVEYEAQAERLTAARRDAGEECLKLEECVEALKARKAQMDRDLGAFQAAQRDAALASGCGAHTDRAERKVARAEAAFGRAMAAAGGSGVGTVEMKDAAKLAEVEALRKEAEIADRLAAMRATVQAKGADAPASPKPRPRRSK